MKISIRFIASAKKENGPVIAKLMDFVENPLEPNVPDPYYTGKFDYTYQLISEGCRHLLQRIKEDIHLHKGEMLNG